MYFYKVSSGIGAVILLLVMVTPGRSQDLPKASALSMRGRPSPDLPFEPPQDWLQWGHVRVHPHCETALTYDDNIFLKRKHQQDDFYVTLSPGIQFLYGDAQHNYFSLDYTSGVQKFFRFASEDSTSHAIRFDNHWEFNRLSLGLAQVYQDTTQGSVEVPDRIRKTVNTSRVDVEYKLTAKTSVGLEYRQDLFAYDASTGLLGYELYQFGGKVFYKVSPKAELFLEADNGWLQTEGHEGDASYQEVDVGIRFQTLSRFFGTAYDPGEAFDVNKPPEGWNKQPVGKPYGQFEGVAKIGYQHRSFSRAANADFDNPVAHVRLVENFSDRSAILVHFDRDVAPSVTSSGNYFTRCRTGLTWRERLLHSRKLLLSVGGEYEHDEYENPVNGVNRIDDFWDVGMGLDYNVTSWLQVGAFYRHRSLHSTLHTVPFEQNLMTLRAIARF